MPAESQIPIASQGDRQAICGAGWRCFTARIRYSSAPICRSFTVWLKAVGIDASWIGIISAVPAVTRFTILPLVTGFAEKRYSLRGALIVTAVLTALGFSIVGTQHLAFAVFLAYAATACVWTPMVPLTDAYALRGVARYGLDYGPLRLWGSAAFVVGALALRVAGRSHRGPASDLGHCRGGCARRRGQPRPAAAGQPKAQPRCATRRRVALLRDPGFLAIIAASALIQGSHAAYYVFGSITWQLAGLGGLTIAALWALGVLAEIVVFALSPRFTLPPAILVVIGALRRRGALADHGAGAVGRRAGGGPARAWADLRADASRHHGPDGAACARSHMARGQGYLAACGGIVTGSASIVSGLIYARYGQGVYYLDGGDGAVGCDRDVARRGHHLAVRSPPERSVRRIDQAAVVAQAAVAVALQQQRAVEIDEARLLARAASPAPSPATLRPCSRP